jgi:hypothetical protein
MDSRRSLQALLSRLSQAVHARDLSASQASLHLSDHSHLFYLSAFGNLLSTLLVHVYTATGLAPQKCRKRPEELRAIERLLHQEGADPSEQDDDVFSAQDIAFSSFAIDQLLDLKIVDINHLSAHVMSERIFQMSVYHPEQLRITFSQPGWRAPKSTIHRLITGATDDEMMDNLFAYPSTDVNSIEGSIDKTTPLGSIISQRYLNMVLGRCSSMNYFGVRRLLAHPELDINMVGACPAHTTVLMAACRGSLIDVVKEILSHPNLDVHVKSPVNGWNALDYALQAPPTDNRDQIVKMLSDNGLSLPK